MKIGKKGVSQCLVPLIFAQASTGDRRCQQLLRWNYLFIPAFIYFRELIIGRASGVPYVDWRHKAAAATAAAARRHTGGMGAAVAAAAVEANGAETSRLGTGRKLIGFQKMDMRSITFIQFQYPMVSFD